MRQPVRLDLLRVYYAASHSELAPNSLDCPDMGPSEKSNGMIE